MRSLVPVLIRFWCAAGDMPAGSARIVLAGAPRNRADLPVPIGGTSLRVVPKQAGVVARPVVAVSRAFVVQTP